MLTHIIGKKNVDGTWRTPPNFALVAVLDEMRQTGEMVTLRARSIEELDQMPDDYIRATAAPYIAAIRAGMPVRVTVSRALKGGTHDHIKRSTSVQREFPTDKPFEVPAPLALKILNRDIIGLLFEEVCDESAEPTPPPVVAPPKPGAKKR